MWCSPLPCTRTDATCSSRPKAASPRHPSWYLNLVAHPEVELTVRGRTLPMRARTATPEERTALWPRITREYSGYAGYQRKTSREIPVVICEPR